MARTFLRSAALSLLILMLCVGSACASGKMEVKISDKITLNAENIQAGSTYRWVVKKGKEILSTQTNSIFNYSFSEQGEYEVNLTVTNAAGTIQNTSIWVMAGDRYPRPVPGGGGTVGGTPGETVGPSGPLSVALTTLPPIAGDARIHLIGDGKVLFTLVPTRSDILEYRIDRNIFADSDGNGTANDDIDNANDESYLKGGSWETQYKTGESAKIVAEVILVAKDGQKAKKQVEIVFDAPPSQEGDPKAILEVTPAPDSKDQMVHLYGGKAKVAFYSRRSEGKILEYRIDKNVFVDSNGDGKPGNDIDNLNDISFKTGDVWETEYEKTDQQIIAQLIVVGEGGKGSRVQRGIVFLEKPAIVSPGEQAAIRLVADKAFVQKGDPIKFTVEGLTQTLDNYSFAWDFNGDGTTEKQVDGDNTAENIYDTPGTYTVKVKVADKQDNSADFSLDTLVKDVVATMADFEFKVDGNKVEFTNMSVVAMNLADKKLDVNWSFGDTDPQSYENQKDQIGLENPTYTYNKAGKYLVTLIVTDADQVTDNKSAEVEIAQDLPMPPSEAPAVTEGQPAPTEGAAEGAAGGGSLILKILKVILYLILAVIILAVLMVVGFLVFLKVQNPGMTFDELIGQMKIKMLTLLGVHEMIEPVPGAPTPSAPAQEEKEEVLEGEVQPKKEDEEDDSDKTPPPAASSGPAPLDQQTGPVPDWLKGVK